MIDQRLRTIRLYGRLGTKFGRVHKLAVKSAAEAFRALCVLKPGFQRYIMTSRENGLVYSVFLGKLNLNRETLHDPSGDSDIRIAPILAGSKRAGSLQTIIGAVIIIIASIYSGGAAAAFSAGGVGGGAVAMAGASMMIGGMIQMLSPQPSGLSTKDGPDNGASYNYNGPINTTAQGNPVPLLYGRMLVGSAVISAGIYNGDQV